MQIVFTADGQSVVWNIPFALKDDQDSVMTWAANNKLKAEAINSGAQLYRLLQQIFKE